jgi:hypothetical protein
MNRRACDVARDATAPASRGYHGLSPRKYRAPMCFQATPFSVSRTSFSIRRNRDPTCCCGEARTIYPAHMALTLRLHGSKTVAKRRAHERRETRRAREPRCDVRTGHRSLRKAYRVGDRPGRSRDNGVLEIFPQMAVEPLRAVNRRHNLGSTCSRLFAPCPFCVPVDAGDAAYDTPNSVSSGLRVRAAAAKGEVAFRVDPQPRPARSKPAARLSRQTQDVDI